MPCRPAVMNFFSEVFLLAGTLAPVDCLGLLLPALSICVGSLGAVNLGTSLRKRE